MRILLMPSSYIPLIGGLETTVREIAREIVSLGHEVRIATLRVPGGSKSLVWVDGIEVHRFDFLRPFFPWQDFKKAFSFPIKSFMSLLGLYSLVKTWRPDVISVHWVGVQTLYAAVVCRLARIPLVLTFHGEDAVTITRMARLSIASVWAGKTVARCMTAVSNHLLNLARELPPRKSLPEFVIRNGVHMFHQCQAGVLARHRPYVLFVGRLERVKGADLLINAFAEVVQNHPELELVITGDGTERERLQSLARALNLESNVTFLGWASESEVETLMSDCYALVVPSRREGLSNIVLKALSMGKPLIATRVGGIPEVVCHGENGIMVDSESPRDIALAVKRLLEDPELKNCFRRSGEGWVNDGFTWQAVARQYIEVFQLAARGGCE